MKKINFVVAVLMSSVFLFSCGGGMSACDCAKASQELNYDKIKECAEYAEGLSDSEAQQWAMDLLNCMK
ncbi:MAG: hypothetical protein CMP51_03955 [Flavobacteriales bacterium]|nr:hypothetical protein [Flavobacteriales bacterium]|tara:strand:+ start:390 stop:596 length:207 start_codon:yes stop_codon:yes gene_type:complete